MLMIQILEPGQKLRLKKNEIVAEVVENPGDGVWLIVKREQPEAEPELCHVDEVLEIL
jgi:hypothetical protein